MTGQVSVTSTTLVVVLARTARCTIQLSYATRPTTRSGIWRQSHRSRDATKKSSASDWNRRLWARYASNGASDASAFVCTGSYTLAARRPHVVNMTCWGGGGTEVGVVVVVVVDVVVVVILAKGASSAAAVVVAESFAASDTGTGNST